MRYAKAKKVVKEYLIANLDDDQSYVPVEFIFDTTRSQTHGWRVEHKFRSKNKFGAVVLNDMYFDLDSSFQIAAIYTPETLPFDKILPDKN
jgi:hypothetical protein